MGLLKGFLKGIIVDEIWITVKGENAEAIRVAVRLIYNIFGPR